MYQHRNDAEAEAFISRLFKELDLPKGSNVLDLACGKGRHALQVHQLGYDVIGIDLSEESIAYASRLEEEGLHFLRGDMRELDIDAKFDLTLNLFTSFGYFREIGDNLKVLRGLEKHLKEDGMIIIDFLNVKHASKSFPIRETVHRESIDFEIYKRIEDGFIIKDIAFEDEGNAFHYQEFVKYLELTDFEEYFNKVGMKINRIFGDYQLNPFDESRSDRLIMIAKHA